MPAKQSVWMNKSGHTILLVRESVVAGDSPDMVNIYNWDSTSNSRGHFLGRMWIRTFRRIYEEYEQIDIP